MACYIEHNSNPRFHSRRDWTSSIVRVGTFGTGRRRTNSKPQMKIFTNRIQEASFRSSPWVTYHHHHHPNQKKLKLKITSPSMNSYCFRIDEPTTCEPQDRGRRRRRPGRTWTLIINPFNQSIGFWDWHWLLTTQLQWESCTHSPPLKRI